MNIRALILAAVLLASVSPGAESGRAAYAVIEKPGGHVGFFAAGGKRVGEAKVNAFPHEGVLSPDGRYLYVTDNGVLWMTEDGPGGNTISIVDVHAMKKVGEINLGRFRRPHGITWDASRKFLLATTERPNGLVMVDVAERKVVRDYDVKGKAPHMVSLGPDGEYAFVSNSDSGSVAAVHLKTGAVKLIPSGENPQGMAVAPSGNRIYVVNGGSNRITIIDPKTREAVGAIPIGRKPGRIAITPDGKTLVYNLQDDLSIGFADVASGKQTGTVDIKGRSLSLTMTRDGKHAFAGVQDQDKVYVISVPERRIERSFNTPKGAGPDPVIPLE